MQLVRSAPLAAALVLAAGCGGSTATTPRETPVGPKVVSAAFRAEGITLVPLLGSTRELLMGYALYHSAALIPGSVGVFRSIRLAVSRGDLFCAGDDCSGIRNVVVALKRTVGAADRRRVLRALTRIRARP